MNDQATANNDSVTSVNDPVTMFHMQEHKELRAEILQRVRDLSITEREVVVGALIAYTWILTNNVDTKLKILGLCLPIVLAGSAWMKINANRQRIRQLGTYLKTIETKLTDVGWEHYLDDQGEREPDLSYRYYKGLGLAYFSAAFCITVFLSIVISVPLGWIVG